jgi:hypothetical protein
MAWAAGTRLFDALIETLLTNVPEDDIRKEIYLFMIDAFTDMDWDCQDECIGSDPVYDSIVDKDFHEEEDD